MIIAVLLCLATDVLFAVAAPIVGPRLPPATGVRLLVTGSVVATACAAFALGVVASVRIGQIGEVAAWGHWSPAALQAGDPLPSVAGIAVSAVLLAMAALCAVTVVRRLRALLSVHRMCRGLAEPGGFTVVDHQVPDAFTTPEYLGRIVVTTGLWRILSAEQRQVLLAHERSHLRHRHAWWRLVAEVSSALNPPLRATTAAVAHAVERWADEEAALQVGDRRLVATTVASAALASRREQPGPRPLAGSAVTGGQVPLRVRSLLAPPPRRRPFLLAGLVAVTLAGVVAAGVVERGGDAVFDHASLVGRQQHCPTSAPEWTRR